jgi:hypothetical protein
VKADYGGRPQTQLVVCAQHAFVIDPHVELFAEGRACSEGAAAIVYHNVGAIGTETSAERTQLQGPIVADVRAQEDLDVAFLKREGHVDARSVGAWAVARRVAAVVDVITGRAKPPQPGCLALAAAGTGDDDDRAVHALCAVQRAHREGKLLNAPAEQSCYQSSRLTALPS